MQPFAPGTPYPFSKAENFRELGGYPAAAGKTVRCGVFFRAGALAAVSSPRDVALFDSLGIKTILDFRSKTERRLLPDPQFAGVRHLAQGAILLPDGAEMDLTPGTLPPPAQMMAEVTGEGDDFLTGVYRALPFGNRAYQTFFDVILQGDVPILWHCSAGKDRTGIAAALLLLALGASRETAMWDYMHTNACRPRAMESFFAKNAAYFALHPEHRAPLMAIEGVSESGLATSLAEIDARYQSFEAYLEAEYDLTAAKLERLRQMYLE